MGKGTAHPGRQRRGRGGTGPGSLREVLWWCARSTPFLNGWGARRRAVRRRRGRGDLRDDGGGLGRAGGGQGAAGGGGRLRGDALGAGARRGEPPGRLRGALGHLRRLPSRAAPRPPQGPLAGRGDRRDPGAQRPRPSTSRPWTPPAGPPWRPTWPTWATFPPPRRRAQNDTAPRLGLDASQHKRPPEGSP